MNRKYLAPFVPFLAAAAIYFGAGFNTAIAEDKPSTEKNMGFEQRIEQIMTDSGECDKVEWAAMPPEKEKKMITCYEENDKKFERKYSINLDNICGVSLRENNHGYIFGLFMGNDVVVKTKDGNIYKMRFWDDSAKEMFNVLNEYTHKNVSKEEVKKCLK